MDNTSLIIKRENVASCYIFSSQKKVLLIHHKKLGKWVAPGGHIEENELPHEAALREVFEEVGLEVQLIDTRPIHIDKWNAISIPQPFFMLLENIPEFKDIGFHQHIDHIYLALYREKIGEEKGTTATEQYSWFSEQEIQEMEDDIEIFSETKEVLHYFFENISLIPAIFSYEKFLEE